MKIVDLTHPIGEEMPVYFPWHPRTEIERTATFEHNRCEVRRITLGTHTGTHIDAPSHVYAGMPALDKYDPALWYLEAQVLDFTPREQRREITREEIAVKLKKRNIGVVVKTGWDRHFGEQDYYSTYPPLSVGAAEFLVEMNVRLIASDTPFTLDVHYVVLKHGIPLVTNINNTGTLNEGMITLIAAPLLVQGSDGAPARVFAVLDQE